MDLTDSIQYSVLHSVEDTPIAIFDVMMKSDNMIGMPQR